MAPRFLPSIRTVPLGPLLILAVSLPAIAEAEGLRAPAQVGGLAGGYELQYAETISGRTDAIAGFEFSGGPEVLEDSPVFGFHQRYAATVRIIDGLEAAAEVRGYAYSLLNVELEDQPSVFGDIGLAAKYAHRIRDAWGIAGLAGYQLYQGVAGRTTVADTATPWIGIAASWFGDDMPQDLPVRAHLNLGYTYDRTINYFGGGALPNDIERLSWNWRRDTFAWGRVGVEMPWGRWLPGIEYAIDLPINDAEGLVADALEHTVHVGTRVRVLPNLMVAAGARMEFGSASEYSPPSVPFGGNVGVSWRFGGRYYDSHRPVRETVEAAPDEIPEPSAPAMTTSVTEPVSAPNTAPTESTTTESGPDTMPDSAPAPSTPSPSPTPEPPAAEEGAPAADDLPESSVAPDDAVDVPILPDDDETPTNSLDDL